MRGRALLPIVLVACSSSDRTWGAGGQGGDGVITGVGGASSSLSATSTSGSTGSGCTLGTPDHCGSCATVCPGVDNAGTKRTCSDATAMAMCGIVCLGEYYDVDGQVDDGCEAQDEPVQDSAATAVRYTLPDVIDQLFKSNPLNVVGFIYGDDRLHDMPPTTRPLGREDWFSIAAVGQGDPSSGMVACLGIMNFPKDDAFEVCISDIGLQTFLPASCATAYGGQMSVCVTPPAATDAGDPYYVRVRKLAGSNTANGYALFLKH